MKFLWGPRGKENYMSEKITVQVGEKQMHIETGKMAKQADGSVVVQSADDMPFITQGIPPELRSCFESQQVPEPKAEVSK